MLNSWNATLLLCFGLVPAINAQGAGALPAKFRDFKVYTTSTPDTADAGRIVATMRLLNSGADALNVEVSLSENRAAGFAGKAFHGRIEAKKEAVWEFDLRPPDGLKYELLHGAITFAGANTGAMPDRELFVAVQGPDPVDFGDTRVEKITARGQVIGTHAPRTPQRVHSLVAATKPSTSQGTPLVLAAGGSSKYQIAFDRLVSPPDAPQLTFEQYSSAAGRPAAEIELAEAVGDLRRCVEVKSGAALPVVSAVPAGAGPAIRVRIAPELPGKPHPDSYRLRTEGDDVVIEATTHEGLRNGIYGLLTDHLDCHWFMPKQLGEEIVIPPHRTISLPPFDETRGPSFSSSIGMSWGSAPRWDRQNRSVINRGRMNFGHAWAGFIDRNVYPFDKFPDMWSRDRLGKIQVHDSTDSSTNFCSTSPDVIRVVAEKINAQFDASPDAIVASIDPNDLAPLCLCDRCVALDASYGVTPQDDKQMADRLLHFSKEIHDRLKPEHKEKYLGILAYGFQTRPPKKAVPHPHHVAIVCDFPYYFDHTRPFNDPTSSYNREFESIVKGWGSKVKQLGFYDYYGHFNFFGPWGIVHKMREDLPAFRDAGGTFIVIESQPNFSMNGLNLYVASRLAWDVDSDVDVLVDQYVTKFYGPAAEPMREFFRVAERHYALTRPGVQAAQRVANRPEFWAELDGHLKRAENVTRELNEADKRFADRVTFHRDGFAFGHRAFEMSSHYGDAAFLNAAFLRESKVEFDRLKAKYTTDDGYWPTMIAPYFYPAIDAQ